MTPDCLGYKWNPAGNNWLCQSVSGPVLFSTAKLCLDVSARSVDCRLLIRKAWPNRLCDDGLKQSYWSHYLAILCIIVLLFVLEFDSAENCGCISCKIVKLFRVYYLWLFHSACWLYNTTTRCFSLLLNVKYREWRSLISKHIVKQSDRTSTINCLVQQIFI